MTQQRSLIKGIVQTGGKVLHAVTFITVVQVLFLASFTTFFTLALADDTRHISSPILTDITVASALIALCTLCIGFGYCYAIMTGKRK